METDALTIADWFERILLGLSLIGTLYMIAAAITFRAFFAFGRAPTRRSDGVTLLKPLHGGEPRLFENLASFLRQDHDGPVQLLCGVQRRDDPAIGVVESLRAAFPDARIDLIVDATPYGANGKITNLVHLEPHIAHDVVVLSDSDMIAPPHYLATLLAALDRPRVGAVTLAYYGRGDSGFWSKLAAAGLSWQFLPGVVFGIAHGLARPCMGSTIAMRRGTLAAIGGFRAFADVLADDYAIGEAVLAQGLDVHVPPLLVGHASVERDFQALWRHELRWGATVRDVVPISYALGLIAIPIPLALLAIPFHWELGLVFAGMALLARMLVAVLADRQAGARTAPLWLLPIRDCLSFAVFVASMAVRSVDWRGATLRMEKHGQISAEPEIPS